MGDVLVDNMPYYYQTQGADLLIQDGNGRPIPDCVLVPDPACEYIDLLILHAIGAPICKACGQALTSQSLYGDRGLHELPAYLLGCKVCKSFTAIVEGKYYSTKNIYGSILSPNLEGSKSPIRLQHHIDRDFYGFNYSNFRELWPLGIYALHKGLYDYMEGHRYFATAILGKLGLVRFRVNNQTEWGFTSVGEDPWILFSQRLPFPGSVSSVTEIHSAVIPQEYLTLHDESFSNAVRVCDRMYDLRRQELVDSGHSAQLRDGARALGLLPPGLSPRVKQELDSCLGKFGKPEKIMARKYYKVKKASK